MRVNKKIWGVIEGFYGRPYSFEERCDLIEFLFSIGSNTYVYGPKSDPYHREEYYRPYPKKKLKEFEQLNTLAKKHNINFNYALSPGVNPNTQLIINKIEKMMDIGISSFSIFYDDIKIKMDKDPAIIQVHTVNEVYKVLKKGFTFPQLFFCPTQYHGFERSDYMLAVVENLSPEIDIFWTGESVVSKKITERHLEKITNLLGRPPLIWDNIFANDYIPGVILRFSYRGREPNIIKKVRGILINPMNQYLQSKPLIFTASEFFRNPYTYNPKKSWAEARRRGFV